MRGSGFCGSGGDPNPTPMAKKKTSAPASKDRTPAKKASSAAKAASRNTASAPSRPAAGPPPDDLAEKAAATQELAAAVPYNPNKPTEFGRDNAVAPTEGYSVKPPTP